MRGVFAQRGATVPILKSLLLAVLTLAAPSFLSADEPTIKVGVLHSLTGTMAISELSLVDAIKMAIGEINDKGGVLGRRLETVVKDGASNSSTFSLMAEKLIVEDKVASVFGCWTSSSRKAVKPLFEQHNNLLWYAVQYEGDERSPNIIYTGAAPNQQITPAVAWCLQEFGPRMFLVGSDYVFPRKANEIIKRQLGTHGLEHVGEEYLDLGSKDFAAVAAKIKAAQPDVVLNTVNGSSNLAFFQALQSAGIKASETPVMSFSVAEDELLGIGLKLMKGHYCSWNYFQSIDTPANKRFVRAFKKLYGEDRVTDDPIEAAYFQVHMFAKAVTLAGSTEVDAVRRAVRGLVYPAPEGLVRIDPRNLHTWKVARIGRIRQDGQFKIVWSSKDPLRPRPYLPQSFLAEANTQGEIMFTEISNMIDLGFADGAKDVDKSLLKAMTDVRGYLGVTRAKFQNAVAYVQPINRSAYTRAWKEFERHWLVLSRLQQHFSKKQLESYDRLRQAKLAFSVNGGQMTRAMYSTEDVEDVNDVDDANEVIR